MPVLLSLHHLLFVLLPIALTLRFCVRPRPATLDVAEGIMRFSLGVGKWVLLVSPLWHLSTLVFQGGPHSLGSIIAWMGFLGLILSLQFACTAAGDLYAGLAGMLGLKASESVQEALALRRFTQGKWLRLIPLLLISALVAMLLQTASPGDAWLHLQALFSPPRPTHFTLIQQARVRTDFHVFTLLAALVCLIGLPHSRDFLREPAPWKAVTCLITFVFAVIMLWTHAAPMS